MSGPVFCNVDCIGVVRANPCNKDLRKRMVLVEASEAAICIAIVHDDKTIL